MWVNCRLDLFHPKEAIEEFDPYFLEKLIKSDGFVSGSQSLTKESLQKTIKILDPRIKETLLDCLREKNLPLHVSGEEDVSNHWYTKYLGFLFSTPDVPRRYLSNTAASAPESSPAPPFFPSNSPDANLQPSGSDTSGSNLSPNKSSNKHRAVIIAVVVTASVTFAVVSLIFCCYFKSHRPGPEIERNDESPLLNSSLSEFSIGMYASGSLFHLVFWTLIA